MVDNMDVETDESSKADLSAIRWLQEAIGDAAVHYLLGCELADLEEVASGAREPSEKQAEVIKHFSNFRQALPSELAESANTHAPRWWLTQVGQEGKSAARSIHEYVAGVDTVPPVEDELERSICELAFDSYAAYSFSPDPDLPEFPFMERPSIRAISLLISHPHAKAFTQSALDDEVLGKAFAAANEHTGHMASIYRNTGSGGSVQLMMLPEMLLTRAWSHLEEGSRSQTAFAAAAINGLREARQLFAGRTVNAKVLTAFTGILLPPGKELKLRDGVVRAVTEVDRKFVPEQIKGKLTTSDAEGNSTVINYDGDVVLETEFRFRIRPMPSEEGIPRGWPEDMRPPASLDTTSTRLRFSLLLAVQRESRVQLVQTWRSFDEPLSVGRGMSYFDARQAIGLMPTQLTDAELAEWGEWHKRLSVPHVSKIDVALTRILRALAERREPSDVLIDSVIAWENIFGSREGEPTLRVTASLAKLLEKAPAARKALKTKLGDIYRLRSDVVHGNAPLDIKQYPLCQEALDIAINAVRVLATERTDILELADGSARSNRLILE